MQCCNEAAVTLNVCTENSGELTLKTFICHRVPPSFRFQTIELSMWINQKNAVPGEMQESVQDLQISFRSGGMVYIIYKQIGRF